MKKNSIKVIVFGLVLACVLTISYVINQNKNTGQKENQPTQKVVKKIGVLQLLSHPALDTIYKGMQDELKNLGYTNDNMEITLLNAQGDQSQLATMSKQLVSDKNDVLVGITTPATLSLMNETKTLPIVMGGVTYPLEAGIIKDEKSPGVNVTGVSDRTPVNQQIELMKEVLPQLKKIGILYTSSEDNAHKQAKDASEYAKKIGLEVDVATITNTNDVAQVTESLASRVDAIFVPIDNTIASAMSVVSNITNRYGIAVFPSADTMVADGGLLGIGVDQYQIGVETARIVVAVLNGAKPETKPIVLANQGVIYINRKVAKALNITIPDSILNKAVFVDEK